MGPGRPPSPARSATFFSVCLFLLITVGGLLQQMFRLPGVALMQVAIFLGLAVGFPIFFREDLREVFRLRLLSLNGVIKSLFLGLLTFGMAQVLLVLLLMLVEQLGGTMKTPYQDLMQAPFLVALVTGALLPAICEEAAFRGYLQWNLGPLGGRAAVLLTGVLFGAMHLSLIRVLPLALLGIVFATAVQRSGSILPGIIMHFVNNATVLVLAFVAGSGAGAESMSQQMSGMAMLYLVVAAIGLGAAAWAMARSFGPHDLAQRPVPPGPEQEITPAPGTGRKAVWALMILPLLPAVLIYSLYAVYEVKFVFGLQ